MAKKFFYVCAGILMLAGSTSPAFTTTVDPDNPYGIAAVHDGPHYLCTDGHVYFFRHLEPPFGWTPYPDYDVPIPVSEIAEWLFRSFTTHDGRYFTMTSNGWAEMGLDTEPIPCIPPVQSDSQSMGDVKSMFR